MELYRRWLAVQDFNFYKTAVTVKSWITTLFIVLFILGSVTFLPIQDSFQTKTLWCMVVFAPAFFLGMTAAFGNERGLITLKTVATLALFGKALLIFAFGAFVSLTADPRGKLLFATLYLFTIGFQGWVVKSSLTDGIGFLPALAGTLGAFLLDPGEQNRATFVLVGPFGLFLNLVLGTWSRNKAKLMESVAEHREAIRLREAELEISRLKQILLGSWGNRHDLSNMASSMTMSAEVLRLQPGLPEKAKRSAEILHKSAARISDIIRSVQEEGKFEQASLASVAVSNAVHEAVECVRIRYPNVAFHTELLDVSVRVVDGKGGFIRMLENLLLNACQGDGKEAANTVRISVREEGEKVAIVVEDNGPGFPKGFFEKHKVLSTTKAGGSGLGLHMIRTIVRVSGGDIKFTNVTLRGARAAILLFKE